eukprot:scaffold31794_cov107-Isochrysis_galbana.AAC.7
MEVTCGTAQADRESGKRVGMRGRGCCLGKKDANRELCRRGDSAAARSAAARATTHGRTPRYPAGRARAVRAGAV